MSDDNVANGETVFGMSWSAAKAAGENVFVAKVDVKKKEIIDISQPWRQLGVADLIAQASAWISSLNGAWVGLDARLGIPDVVIVELIQMGWTTQREVAQELVARFGTDADFEKAVAATRLRTGNRRTDTDATTPLQNANRTAKTHSALRLLCAVPTVALLPSEHAMLSSSSVKLVEVSSEKFIARKWKDYLDYDRRRESREALLDVFLQERGWTCSNELREVALRAQGHGIDAVIAVALALWASRHKPEQHAKRSRRHLLEGYIYCP